MRKFWVSALCASALIGGAALADKKKEKGDRGRFKANLTSYQQVPTLSTAGKGEFRAQLNSARTMLMYTLTYSGLEGGAAAASHIHLGARATNGGVIAFLCGGGGKPSCPGTGGTVEGTIVASDVIGPTGQGISPGEFEEALRGIDAGATYVNVHNATYPGGEIRGQIKGDGGRD